MAVLVMALVMMVTVSFFAGILIKTHREFAQFEERERRIEAELAQARKTFSQQEAYYHRLLNDPEFLERIARERLGYARPDELVFRFSD